MITTRQSGATKRNSAVGKVGRAPASNGDFYTDAAKPGAVVLIGGSNVLHFRLRVAQSHLRHDLLPSFWSLAGLVVSTDRFLSVPVGAPLTPDTVPERNAVEECAIAAFDDPVEFPNIAVIDFAEPADGIVDYARRLRSQRGAIDLPQLLVAWLAFVWGAGSAGNPLLENIGMPSSALIETAFGMGGIELTPGVASASSCPEAIWQSAIWWQDYYRKTAQAPVSGGGDRGASVQEVVAKVPSGRYVVRQPAAAVIEKGDRPSPQSGARRPARRRNG